MLDAHRFQRVLSNIISNSVKFTPEHGTIRISACCTETSESGYARYEIKVADTGIGMSEEFMKRMFEAFEREVSSTVNSNSGTGLGLTITKNLLDIMGGSLQVESTKGAGSVFTIGLPLKSADHSSTADGQTDDTVPSSASDTKSQHRILLVEDIEINRVLAETILEEAGYLVASVPDGCDAVDAITNHPEWYYDLVLMDIQMPVMNGYEATRAIRALKREDAKTLPIIALSANARDEDRQRSMESGMNHHIAKPFDVDQLIQAIQDHIRH
ncbi:MAG: response regulator [Lachnospiraceae bacterium]|nr:response regulator [Lachnospiraceae bacterium]